MPTYEYKCETCGITFERRQRMTDEPLKQCPECDGPVHRVLYPVGIVFKGSGWYCTDNRTGDSSSIPAADKEKTETKSDTGEKKQADKAPKAEKAEKADKPEKAENKAETKA